MNKFKKLHTKTKLAASILFALTSLPASAEMFELGSGNNNFTMLGGTGAATGGTNDVVAMWDGTFNNDVATAVTNMTLTSATPFFGTLWFAHDIQVFSPGTYTFEACPGPVVNSIAADGSKCSSGGSTPQTMVVGEGQVGVHMLFDWNSSVNIDVINVWDVNAVWGFQVADPNLTSTFLDKSQLDPTGTNCEYNSRKFPGPLGPECEALLATEWMFVSTDPDGDGVPGVGMVDGPFGGFNASFNIRPAVVPVPAAVWLMGSGLLGLVGVARRKKR